MSYTRQSFLLLVSITLLTGCASSRIPGEHARVSVSPGFSPSVVHAVGVLPMTLEGNPDRHSDHLVGDRLSTRLLDLGFRVIDQTQLESEAHQRNIDLAKPLDEKDRQQLAQALKVDAYVTGSITWSYIPGHSESNPSVLHTSHTEIKTIKDKDGRTRNDTTVIHDEVPTVQQSSTESQYVMTGESIKILSASSGEMLIGGFASSGYYDMTDEIVDAIRERLFPSKKE